MKKNKNRDIIAKNYISIRKVKYIMFKKVVSIISAAAIMATLLVGCSCNGEAGTTSSGAQPNAINNSVINGEYENQNYKYKLTIPGEVKDDISINGNDSVVTIYVKYVKDLGAKDDKGNKYEGKLGTIWVEGAQASIPYEHYDVLGKDDEHQYVLQYPEEQQYDPDDKEAKESYENTKEYLDDIAKSFTLG